ncbi:TetR/AcrR family transcriptional regulator [Pseudooceanicola sp. 200-1SW]|uniref:TetR/AcrR family transcriptional regulator n=1 Tax=Pseudooceanicola sp. 200-1SW TaxID=3425949 RepID=UPI003D7F7C8A
MSAQDRKSASPWASREDRASIQRRKREAVLETAVRHFNARGFGATSMDDVAAELNVTKPTIYHYFKSKDEILFACVRRGLDGLREAAVEAVGAQGPALWRLVQVMRRYGLIMTQDFGRIVTRTGDFELSEESRAKFRALKREIDLSMRALVQEGLDDGSIRGSDARMITFTITGSLNWIGRWYDPEGADSARDVVESVIATLLAGLEA